MHKDRTTGTILAMKMDKKPKNPPTRSNQAKKKMILMESEIGSTTWTQIQQVPMKNQENNHQVNL